MDLAKERWAEEDMAGLPTPTFRGWMALNIDCLKNGLQLQEFQPKKWQETDIEVRITHCGLCGSDLHTLRSGWVSRCE